MLYRGTRFCDIGERPEPLTHAPQPRQTPDVRQTRFTGCFRDIAALLTPPATGTARRGFRPRGARRRARRPARRAARPCRTARATACSPPAR
eukprot:scaffold55167_cov66-Phaeocystis_antarctica.AAC.3